MRSNTKGCPRFQEPTQSKVASLESDQLLLIHKPLREGRLEYPQAKVSSFYGLRQG